MEKISIYRSKTQGYMAEMKYRSSEARDTRKELIYMLIYTDIHELYTKNGFCLNPKKSSEFGPRKAQIQFLPYALII